jgi:hypothetical protein
VRRRRAAAAHQVDELRTHRLLLDQFVAGLLGESLEIAHRTGIGGHHKQGLTALHGVERLLGLEYRQRAVQAPGIDFNISVHRNSLDWRDFMRPDRQPLRPGRRRWTGSGHPGRTR